MAKDILKEAIADAKAVREVALANAKAALEEAFTPKLQSMLSAKLSEELDDEINEEDELDEIVTFSTTGDGTDTDIQTLDIDETYDEEVDLEEILNELGLEEGEEADEDLDELEEIQTVGQPNYKADDMANVVSKADDVNKGLTEEVLDKMLEDLNTLSLKENKKLTTEINPVTGQPFGAGAVQQKAKGFEYWQNHPEILAQRLNMDVADIPQHLEFWAAELEAQGCVLDRETGGANQPAPSSLRRESKGVAQQLATAQNTVNEQRKEINKTKETLQMVRKELNEVNLLNSKLLYVNRLFKSSNLSDTQKLNIIESFDKATSVKETKLIYETLKGSLNKQSFKKSSKKSKTIKENFGMASKAAGTYKAPKKAIISESDNLVTRFQKLANIKVKQ